MSTRRTRRTAATAEVSEEVVTIETRSKRTRAAPRKAAATTTTTSSKVSKTSTRSKRATTPSTDTTTKTRASAQPATRQNAVASTPAPATTSKRRLRSTATESASPLRALDEQPAKRQRTTSRKAPARSAAAKSVSSQDDDEDEETPVFFTKKFDSFDVLDYDPKPEFMTGDESALALLRHVQEAARSPRPIETASEDPAPSATQIKFPSPSPTVVACNASTPSRSIFASFTTPFTALKNLFGSPAAASPPSSPTPSRQPPPGSITETLTIPPTPIGERAKRPAKKATRKPNRFVKALLQGVAQEEVERATAWAESIAAELQKDSAAGEKRKRLETPVLFRDLEHLPASKPWQSGFSLPEDVLDLEDDDIVPAWAVYTSMVEEEHRQTKKSKIAHAAPRDDDMPASLNEVFGTSTTSHLDFTPRRSVEPSPMFDTPLHHKEGGNIFTELHGHDAIANDRKNLQRDLKAGGSELHTKVSIPNAKSAEGLHRPHDPAHGSFSVPDSDSEDEDEEVPSASPVWTQAPPPAPTPAHIKLPNTSQVEVQRQKLMKHTPHKPSRLQQVSYPSPSVMSDAGASPIKSFDGEMPDAEPLVFGDAHLDAAIAALEYAEGLQAQVSGMHWSTPVVVYDSEEEDLSPI
ncbi:hypothetical protein E8E12_006866 [Didymella heteroderae]|uniref:Uncharacterized protein n=1 Tax=Didymella heteroderae TaxID=1769908 RepID=A0A9P4WL80_9PLEO|nr:hypothetical protein E8E12_006866 [Didymella heteroderae]